ncbi:Adenosine monophosphate-protein transferase, variant 3 [Balamuthia mandrillaris]
MEEEKVGASAKVHLEIEVVTVENPESLNFILGQAHFIKTVEDIYEVMVQSSTAVKFGLAFCEASGERLIRWDGNDDDLIKLAKTNATRIGAGHSFIIFMRNAYPISVLPALKRVPEVATVFCASANPVQVL